MEEMEYLQDGMPTTKCTVAKIKEELGYTDNTFALSPIMLRADNNGDYRLCIMAFTMKKEDKKTFIVPEFIVTADVKDGGNVKKESATRFFDNMQIDARNMIAPARKGIDKETNAAHIAQVFPTLDRLRMSIVKNGTVDKNLYMDYLDHALYAYSDDICNLLLSMSRLYVYTTHAKIKCNGCGRIIQAPTNGLLPGMVISAKCPNCEAVNNKEFVKEGKTILVKKDYMQMRYPETIEAEEIKKELDETIMENGGYEVASEGKVAAGVSETVEELSTTTISEDATNEEWAENENASESANKTEEAESTEEPIAEETTAMEETVETTDAEIEEEVTEESTEAATEEVEENVAEEVAKDVVSANPTTEETKETIEAEATEEETNVEDTTPPTDNAEETVEITEEVKEEVITAAVEPVKDAPKPVTKSPISTKIIPQKITMTDTIFGLDFQKKVFRTILTIKEKNHPNLVFTLIGGNGCGITTCITKLSGYEYDDIHMATLSEITPDAFNFNRCNVIYVNGSKAPMWLYLAINNLPADNIVFFVGNQSDVDAFTVANRGLAAKSIFTIEFYPYNIDTLFNITNQGVKKYGLKLPALSNEERTSIFTGLNGATAKQLSNACYFLHNQFGGEAKEISKDTITREADKLKR